MLTLRESELDDLMSRLARGDRSAFDGLYRALAPRAVRLARLRLAEADAGDVAQTALMKVFSRASVFTPGRPCLPWFYAIVANEIQATRRRGDRVARVAADEDASERVVAPGDDAEAELVHRELDRALDLAIEALDDDASHAILAVLGREPAPAVPPATLRKRVSRAYAKLRILLGGHHVG